MISESTILRDGQSILVKNGDKIIASPEFWERKRPSDIDGWRELVLARGGDPDMPMEAHITEMGNVSLNQNKQKCLCFSPNYYLWKYFIFPCDVKEFPHRPSLDLPKRIWAI